MDNQKEWEDYFKRYPDIFMEMFCPDVKLHLYQKLILRYVYTSKLYKLIDKYKKY